MRASVMRYGCSATSVAHTGMARTHKSAAIRVRIETSLPGALSRFPSTRLRKCASPSRRSRKKRAADFSAAHQFQEFCLGSELDRQTGVEEASDFVIWTADGVVLAHAVFSRVWRILVEQVVDAEGDERS